MRWPNKASWITGGDDGLQGMEVWPIFGQFRFDMFGRTGYLSTAVAVLFLCWYLARHIVHSPFGRSLTGIRENVRRMHAIGAPVRRRRLIIYHNLGGVRRHRGRAHRADHAIRRAQLPEPRTLRRRPDHADHRRVGRLYGAFIGVPLYMIAQKPLLRDRAGLLVLLDRAVDGAWSSCYARGGVLVLAERLRR